MSILYLETDPHASARKGKLVALRGTAGRRRSMSHFGNKDFPDIHAIMEEIFATAEDIRNAVAQEMGFDDAKKPHFSWSEQRDYYPAYAYPPLNVYMTADKSIVFQFALAGFDEKDISLQFKGDYLLFSAKAPAVLQEEEEVQYLKRRLKLKAIEEQKYYVPADKFAQEKGRAVIKNAVLTLSVPARELVAEPEGIPVTIVNVDGV